MVVIAFSTTFMSAGLIFVPLISGKYRNHSDFFVVRASGGKTCDPIQTTLFMNKKYFLLMDSRRALSPPVVRPRAG
jgi:hypothetical protein